MAKTHLPILPSSLLKFAMLLFGNCVWRKKMINFQDYGPKLFHSAQRIIKSTVNVAVKYRKCLPQVHEMSSNSTGNNMNWDRGSWGNF